MRLLFLILSLITIVAACGAVTFRQLIHCALCLALSFFGLALIYLQLGAQFVGLAQILVYVGAVAILVVFAVLLTRGGDSVTEARWGGAPWLGVAIAVATFVGLGVAILSSGLEGSNLMPAESVAGDAAVLRIGTSLMTDYVLPLQAVGVLLTAALIGGVIVAMQEEPSGSTTGVSGPRGQGEGGMEAGTRTSATGPETKGEA
jgi:NADH-quinone oxidoreductase subunit J